nr:AtpZ/AtpI family protein [uncultured Veillonella sp.]
MATSAGLTLLFCIGGFIWIGYQLDQLMDTAPLCMVIFGLTGAVTGFYMLYKQVK